MRKLTSQSLSGHVLLSTDGPTRLDLQRRLNFTADHSIGTEPSCVVVGGCLGGLNEESVN